MANKVPQHSDVILKFSNIKNADNTVVDLATVDDIFLTIAYKKIGVAPFLELKKSTSPSLFIIDNVAKSVSVKLLATQISSNLGKYFVNLWVESGGRFTTHFTQNFDVVLTVPYV